MKTSKILIMSLVVHALCAAVLIMSQHKIAVQTQISQLPTKKIAIMLPATHPAMDSIEQGFRKSLSLSKKGEYAITTFNGNGNRQLMQAQVKQVFDGSFDLVFTVGAGLSSLANTIAGKALQAAPLICGAVASPEKLGIVQSKVTSRGNVTCIIEPRHFKEQVALLCAIKPTVEQVLIVYDHMQGGGMEEERLELQAELMHYGIKVKALEVQSSAEVYAKTASQIAGCDVVIILKDHTTVSAVDGLIKLCNQQGVTLMASDLDSGIKGAALSYGVEESAFGEQAAVAARKILEDGIAAADIPFQAPDNYHLQINLPHCGKQGIMLDQKQRLLLCATKVIGA